MPVNLINHICTSVRKNYRIPEVHVNAWNLITAVIWLLEKTSQVISGPSSAFKVHSIISVTVVGLNLRCSFGAFVLAAFRSSSRPLWSRWSDRLLQREMTRGSRSVFQEEPPRTKLSGSHLLLFPRPSPASALRFRRRLGGACLGRRLFGPTVTHACVCPPASKSMDIKAWKRGLGAGKGRYNIRWGNTFKVMCKMSFIA